MYYYCFHLFNEQLPPCARHCSRPRDEFISEQNKDPGTCRVSIKSSHSGLQSSPK